jgi:hypothetical protein
VSSYVISVRMSTHLADFPNVILDVERVELDIACGLQDRVAQAYGGLMFMDFTGHRNIYTEVDKGLLPPMYLAYNTSAGYQKDFIISDNHFCSAQHE